MKLSWDVVEDLANRYGDAFHLLDLPQFEHNLVELAATFRAIDPETSLAYSYTTNYVPRVCRRAYDLALGLGVPPEKIMFNGPLKLTEDIERVLLDGARFNLDYQSSSPLNASVGCMSRHWSRPVKQCTWNCQINGDNATC